MYGEKLKQIRKQLKLTQQEMSDNLEISYRTYAAYERNENKPSYSMLVLLNQKNNINLNWFIAGEGEMFNRKPFEQVEDQLTQKVESILKKRGLI